MTRHKKRTLKRKHTHRRKGSQRGGFWPFTSSEQTAPSTTTTSSWSDWLSGVSNKAKEATTGLVNNTENALTNASNSISNGISNTFSNSNQSPGPVPNAYSSQVAGRRKKRRKMRTKKMRGGRGLGLTYYASPVSGIKMADPTTWI